MHELIDYLTEYELSHAEEICMYLKPDALFHHDDWGISIKRAPCSIVCKGAPPFIPVSLYTLL